MSRRVIVTVAPTGGKADKHQNPMVYLQAIWRDVGASPARAAFVVTLGEVFAPETAAG